MKKISNTLIIILVCFIILGCCGVTEKKISKEEVISILDSEYNSIYYDKTTTIAVLKTTEKEFYNNIIAEYQGEEKEIIFNDEKYLLKKIDNSDIFYFSSKQEYSDSGNLKERIKMKLPDEWEKIVGTKNASYCNMITESLFTSDSMAQGELISLGVRNAYRKISYQGYKNMIIVSEKVVKVLIFAQTFTGDWYHGVPYGERIYMYETIFDFKNKMESQKLLGYKTFYKRDELIEEKYFF